MSLAITLVIAGLVIWGLALFLRDEFRQDRDGRNPRM